MSLIPPAHLQIEAQGIAIRLVDADAALRDLRDLEAWLDALGLPGVVRIERVGRGTGDVLSLRLSALALQKLVPAFDTLQIAARMNLRPQLKTMDLERETMLAMLASPAEFYFPSLRELQANVRMRRNMVQAAARTALAFDTEAIERPLAYWTYVEDAGFVLNEGVSLVDALSHALQPELSGGTFAFSCYRATEYVNLLGIVEELQDANPALLQALESRWRTRPIMSGAFHEVFLREYGSLDNPLPMGYYVPGDRVWFRNPDSESSNACGYEGSWVIYLGGGRFSDFWRAGCSYGLEHKCVEVYHWRHGASCDDLGEWRMDEGIVERRVEETLARPEATQEVLQQMMRYRDPKGVYASGGCIDATREYPRWVCPGTTDVVLPAS